MHIIGHNIYCNSMDIKEKKKKKKITMLVYFIIWYVVRSTVGRNDETFLRNWKKNAFIYEKLRNFIFLHLLMHIHTRLLYTSSRCSLEVHRCLFSRVFDVRFYNTHSQKRWQSNNGDDLKMMNDGMKDVLINLFSRLCSTEYVGWFR